MSQMYYYTTCPSCGGSGETECFACSGTRYNFYDGGQCEYCHGTGTVVCSTCGGSGEIETDN